MDATIVYSVAKALPKEERFALYKMLREEMSISYIGEIKEAPVLTDYEAINYLIKNTFSNKKQLKQ